MADGGMNNFSEGFISLGYSCITIRYGEKKALP
jgi:hypothetical protein